MSYSVTVRKFGDHAVLIEWPESVSLEVSRDIFNAECYLKTHIDNLQDIVTAYNSLTLYLKKSTAIEPLIDDIKLNFENRKWWKPSITEPRHWCLPVCYDPVLGFDIESLAESKSISVQELVRLHTQPIYHVCFLGFLPGFPYLNGLDSRLHASRKETPRLEIPSGSVAIGGHQTGVYPQTSPGGWQIIGRTPVKLFDVNEGEWLRSGDDLQFFPITLKEFEEIKVSVEKGEFERKELLND